MCEDLEAPDRGAELAPIRCVPHPDLERRTGGADERHRSEAAVLDERRFERGARETAARAAIIRSVLAADHEPAA